MKWVTNGGTKKEDNKWTGLKKTEYDDWHLHLNSSRLQITENQEAGRAFQ